MLVRAVVCRVLLRRRRRMMGIEENFFCLLAVDGERL